MVKFTVGRFIEMSVNIIMNSNKLKNPIHVLKDGIVCDREDLRDIKELLKRREIRVKLV